MTTTPTVIEFNVTQAHIDESLRANCYHCPVARALRPFFPDDTRIAVFIDSAEIISGSNISGDMWYPTAATADLWREFIHNVDRIHPVRPCRLAIERRTA